MLSFLITFKVKKKLIQIQINFFYKIINNIEMIDLINYFKNTCFISASLCTEKKDNYLYFFYKI